MPGGLGFVGGGTPPPSPAFPPAKPQAGFGSPSASKSGLSLGAVLLQGAQGRDVCCLQFFITVLAVFCFTLS